MNTNKTAAKQTRQAKKEPRLYERFGWPQRIAHILLLSSFTLLGITGLAQKFSTTAWAIFIIRVFGGIEYTRLTHHVCAIILMLLAVYHILDSGYKIFVRRTRLSMLPGVQDIKDAWRAFMYNLGLAKTRPQMGRYTFEEKAEYWALIWGTAIMAITGFMMWNPIASARFLPGEVIPAAKAAHGGEALLAVMAIVVWHMYGVHLKRFNKAMWTGKLTEEEMLHEHPIELADLKAGLADRPIDSKTLRKRRIIYYPVAGILAVIMLLGIYGFITGEKTTITTIPPVANLGPAYVPQTPTPSPTPQPTSATGGLALTWDGSIGPLFQAKCAGCHNASAATGLSLLTYTDAMKGSQTGPVIIPGDAVNSKLIQVQSAGGHPAQLTADEITLVKNWILAGAPEK